MDERGIGASQLATYLHVSHVSVGNWLKGTYLPEVPNIIKIARYFKVDPDYLLELVGYRPRPYHEEALPDFHIYVSRKFRNNPRLQRALVAAYEALTEAREEEERKMREREKGEPQP